MSGFRIDSRIGVEEAWRRVDARAEALSCEVVPVTDALERILAEPLDAKWDLPLRDVSIMDGYAVRSSDLAPGAQVTLPCMGESAAGHPHEHELAPGNVLQISTGAVVPRGADAVVAREDTHRDGDLVTIDGSKTGSVTPGTFIRRAGSEQQSGGRLLEAGCRLGPGELSLLAACGHAEVPVHRRPRVAIVSTGDELVPIGAVPPPGRIVSTNGMMLEHLIERAGGTAVNLGDIADDRAALGRALEQGLQHDVLVTSGGISVGEHDLVADVLTELGCTFTFRGVSLRPGKPTAFAHRGNTLVFALPGNPASTFVAFWLWVRPALARLGGVRGDPRAPRVTVELAEAASGSRGRTHYLRARLSPDGRRATPLSHQLSGNLRSLCEFDVLVEVPPDTDLPAGTPVQAHLVHSWWPERNAS